MEKVFPKALIRERTLWVFKHIILGRSNSLDDFIVCCLDHYLNITENFIKNHGPTMAIKKLKIIRLHTTRYLAGEPLFLNDLNVSVNKKGIPRCLGPLQTLIDQAHHDVVKMRLVHTILILSRALNWNDNKIDYSSITRTPTIKLKIDNNEIYGALKELKINRGSYPGWTKFHQTTKSGPNGQALITSVTDAFALSSFEEPLLEGIKFLSPQVADSIEWLKDNIDYDGYVSFFEQVYQEAHQERIKELAEEYLKKGKDPSGLYKIKPPNPWTPNPQAAWNTRRLSKVHDPENKTRIVAVIDYFSQTVLKPIHDQVMDTLRDLKADKTFRQTERTYKVPTDGSRYYSFDLSNATDRFPVRFQETVMEYLFGSDVATVWKRIMVETPFFAKGEPSLIKYKTGQPMGAYSSWPVFTLSHHCVVVMAGRRLGYSIKETQEFYYLLGDDIVIFDSRLAEVYSQIITHELGVEISRQKTHVSSHSYEFAKRWYYNGTEVTGIPIKGYLQLDQHYWRLLPELLESMQRVGRTWNDLAPSAFPEFFNLLKCPFRLHKRAKQVYVWLAHVKGVARSDYLSSDPMDRVGKVQDIYQALRTLAPLPGSCVRSREMQDNLYRNIIKDTLAKEVEVGHQWYGVHVNRFHGFTMELFQDAIRPDVSVGLHETIDNIPPIAILNDIITTQQEYVNIIMEDRLSDNELFQKSMNPTVSNPFSLVQGRKKDMFTKSQVLISRKILEYLQRIQHITDAALRLKTEDEGEELMTRMRALLPRHRLTWAEKGYPFLDDEAIDDLKHEQRTMFHTF